MPHQNTPAVFRLKELLNSGQGKTSVALRFWLPFGKEHEPTKNFDLRISGDECIITVASISSSIIRQRVHSGIISVRCNYLLLCRDKQTYFMRLGSVFTLCTYTSAIEVANDDHECNFSVYRLTVVVFKLPYAFLMQCRSIVGYRIVIKWQFGVWLCCL